MILKNDKTIIAYLENYLCNSQNIEANMWYYLSKYTINILH